MTLACFFIKIVVKTFLKNLILQGGVFVHTCNSNTQEAEAKGS